MLTEAELAQLRADEAEFLPDTCVVTRAGEGEPEFDPETGDYEYPDRVTVYEGPCRVAPLPVQDRQVIFGERAVDLVAFRATFPYDTPEFRKDDHVVVSVSADAQLVGRPLEVHGFEAKSLQTKRRVVLQEVR